MKPFFDILLENLAADQWRITAHANMRIITRGIGLSDVLRAANNGRVIENYPDYHLGPAALVLSITDTGLPLHSLWGIVKATATPVYLVTTYWPNPDEWSSDFAVRK